MTHIFRLLPRPDPDAESPTDPTRPAGVPTDRALTPLLPFPRSRRSLSRERDHPGLTPRERLLLAYALRAERPTDAERHAILQICRTGSMGGSCE